MLNKLALILLFLTIITSIVAQSPNRSDIKMRSEYGSKDADLMSVLYFEDIGVNKMIFSGNDLSGKNYQITVKKFIKGKLVSSDVVFNSTEDEYFKIRGDKFTFRILTKTTTENIAKFYFQFSGFSKQKEYKIGPNDKAFASKTFLGDQEDITIPINQETYILTYMMPYKKKDGSTQYCEVAQSGISPEEFGLKYAIPTYFLIAIKFQ